MPGFDIDHDGQMERQQGAPLADTGDPEFRAFAGITAEVSDEKVAQLKAKWEALQTDRVMNIAFLGASDNPPITAGFTRTPESEGAVYLGEGDNIAEVLAGLNQGMLDHLALTIERQILGPVTGHWEDKPLTRAQTARRWLGNKILGAFRTVTRGTDVLAEWMYEGGLSTPIDRFSRRLADRILPPHRDTHRWVPNPEAEDEGNPNCRSILQED